MSEIKVIPGHGKDVVHKGKTPSTTDNPVYTLDQCRLCFISIHGTQQKAGIPQFAPHRERPACKHFGKDTGEKIKCPVCKGHVELNVFACSQFGKCTPTKSVDGVACCDNCVKHETWGEVPEAGEIRHLLFHLYPRRNSVWHWHSEQIKQHAHLFNGKRIAAIVTDSTTVTAREAEEVYGKVFEEYIELPNDGNLREVASLMPLLSRIKSDDPREVFLWAHGKGVTSGSNPTVYRWMNSLYNLYCGHSKDAIDLLKKHPIAGAFKCLGNGWKSEQSLSDWHYSGSWFWCRSRDLFGQLNWKKIDRFYGGIESYPSLHFAPKDAGVIFHEGKTPGMDLYSESYWRDMVDPAYAKWYRERHSPPSPVPQEGLKIELGGGKTPKGKPWLNVDKIGGPGVDFAIDFETLNKWNPLPFEDDSVSDAFSSHCFEHVKNLHGLLHEMVRVCRIGAKITVVVPHYLSPMAMCHDHKQVIPPEQIDHWCRTAIDYWWKGCKKRLKHVNTEQIPSSSFGTMRSLFKSLTAEQVMSHVPGTSHEIQYTFTVIENVDD